MDTLLILSGLLLMLFGLVWLIMLAFGSSLFWGLGSLFPPLTLVYAVRHWRIARKAVVLAALGGIPLVVGVVLLASRDPVRFEAIVSLRWLTPAPIKANELTIALHGQLNAEPFAPQQAELIDGVLSLREGTDFFAQREVNIHLPPLTNGAVHLNVLPTDAQPLPEVEISWLLLEHDLPEARRLNHGYTLYLDLKPVPPNKMAGDFHLVLPAQFKTTLSGKIELFTDRLRYVNGKVDTHFDSRDTLNYVLEDYLRRRYAGHTVRLVKLPAVSFPANNFELEIEALVDAQPQPLTLQLIKTEALGWAVEGDQFAHHPEPVVVAAAPAPALSNNPPPAARSAVDRRLRFSLERLQRSPEQYNNLLIRATTAQGSAAQGRFAGINANGRIVIRREQNGPGEASYILRPDDISQIELLEP
jgi:hypothetical protein